MLASNALREIDHHGLVTVLCTRLARLARRPGARYGSRTIATEGLGAVKTRNDKVPGEDTLCLSKERGSAVQ